MIKIENWALAEVSALNLQGLFVTVHAPNIAPIQLMSESEEEAEELFHQLAQSLAEDEIEADELSPEDELAELTQRVYEMLTTDWDNDALYAAHEALVDASAAWPPEPEPEPEPDLPERLRRIADQIYNLPIRLGLRHLSYPLVRVAEDEEL